VVPKPASLTFEQAAAVPMAALTALQGIRDVGEVRAGHRVLVNGAAGGVGTYAVQIRHHRGVRPAGAPGKQRTSSHVVRRPLPRSATHTGSGNW
jgi:NADPH:quinone reductase-like Zn-dependent oxidoreductase